MKKNKKKQKNILHFKRAGVIIVSAKEEKNMAKSIKDIQIKRMEAALKGYRSHCAEDVARGNIALLEAFVTEARILGIHIDPKTDESIRDHCMAERLVMEAGE